MTWSRWIPPSPPLAPMTFTRTPVLPFFFMSGLLGMGVGFLLGVGLWLGQLGLITLPGEFDALRTLHAHVQLYLFAVSFLLGFSLQAGPHVVGGMPPSARAAVLLLPGLWLGALLAPWHPQVMGWLGRGALTATLLAAAWLVAGMVKTGAPERRLPIGLPFVLGYVMLAILPWFDLATPQTAVAALLAGVLPIVLAAAQQLIANVLGGHRLAGDWGRAFAGLLLLAWAGTLAAVAGLVPWPWLAAPWWAVLLAYLAGTRLLPALIATGPISLTWTLGLGFAPTLVAPLYLLDGSPAALDGAAHLLALGTVTPLIMGVAARVATFFSAGWVLPERVLSAVLILWMAVALGRALAPLGWVPVAAIPWLSGLALALLTLWGARVGVRVRAIWTLVPPGLRSPFSG